MPCSDISRRKRTRFPTNISCLLLIPLCSLFPDPTPQISQSALQVREKECSGRSITSTPHSSQDESTNTLSFTLNPTATQQRGEQSGISNTYIRFACPYRWALDQRPPASSTSLHSIVSVPSRYATQHHVAPDSPTWAILPFGDG